MLEAAVVDWLLEGPAFVRYRTLVDLVGVPGDDRKVQAAYEDMLSEPLVCGLVREVNAWEDQPPLVRHNDASHHLHRLAFAADIGLTARTLRPALDAVLRHRSLEGPYQVRVSIPPAFGGDGVPKWDWVGCDAPVLMYALLRLGVGVDETSRGVEHILSRAGEGGFPCFASAAMGKFRGPGRKGDPCPTANLFVLRMLAEAPGLADSAEARVAAETLLHHWEQRGLRKYYLFGIGTEFAKPKAPLVWYDIVHYVDTLTRFPSIRGDGRLRDAVEQLASLADERGRLVAGSIWTAWKGWEFCQKKAPSYWLTFLLHRACRRLQQ